MEFKEIDQFAEWVQKIEFDIIENKWKGHFKPNITVECFHFKDLMEELRDHCINEIKILICEIFEVTLDQLTSRFRKGEISKTRWITALVLLRYFDLPLVKIASSLGYRHHAILYRIEDAQKDEDVKQRLIKVYQKHPWLYRRIKKHSHVRRYKLSGNKKN